MSQNSMLRAVVVGFALLSLNALVIACGSESAPTPVVVEVEKIVEVEKPVIVEKQVIVEVEKPLAESKDVDRVLGTEQVASRPDLT